MVCRMGSALFFLPSFTLAVKGFSGCHPVLWGDPLFPSGLILVPFQSFQFLLSHILRNFSSFQFLQIQILGRETVIVVIFRHFPQNRVSNMPHDYVPWMWHFLCQPPSWDEGKVYSLLIFLIFPLLLLFGYLRWSFVDHEFSFIVRLIPSANLLSISPCTTTCHIGVFSTCHIILCPHWHIFLCRCHCYRLLV